MVTAEGRKTGRTRTALQWIASFLLAGYAVFVLHDLLVNNLPPHAFDAELQRTVLAPGFEWRRESEGYGSTRVGKLGILGVPDAAGDPRPKVLIWGDSYVEGMEVSDEERVPQVTTRLWNRNRDRPILALGIGAAGWSLADHYFYLPRYHRVLPRHVLDVFVLSGLGDALPNNPVATRSRFVYRGEFELVADREVRVSAESTRRQALLHSSHLGYPAQLLRRILDGRAFEGLRFAPGPVAPAPPEVSSSDDSPEFVREAFDWLLTRLAGRTTQPALVLLMPNDTPQIEDGRVVTTARREKHEEEFRKACRRAGLDFRSLRKPFNRAYLEEGVLPRGFANSLPGQGHLNAVGHRILAEAIVDYLKEHEDAILQN